MAAKVLCPDLYFPHILQLCPLIRHTHHAMSSSIIPNILQCNVHEHKTTGLLNAVTQQEADILLLQEISDTQLDWLLNFLALNKTWQLVRATADAVAKRTYAAILVRDRHKILEFDNAEENYDMVYVQVEHLGGFISVYNHNTGINFTSPTFCARLTALIDKSLRYAAPTAANLLVAGDFNAQHPSWTSKSTTKGTRMGNIISTTLTVKRQLTLLTKCDTITFVSRLKTDIASTIDLAYATADFRNFEVIPNLEMLRASNLGGKRHHPLLLKYRDPRGGSEPDAIVDDEYPWLSHAGVKAAVIGKHLEEQLPPVASSLSTEMDPNEGWKSIHTVLKNVAARGREEAGFRAGKSSNPNRSKHWYNDDCRVKKLERAKAVSLFRSVRHLDEELDVEHSMNRAERRMESNQKRIALDALLAAKEAFKFAVKQAKESVVAEKVNDLIGNGSSRLWTFVKCLRGTNRTAPTPIPTLIVGEKLAVSFQEKTKALVNVLFPGFRPQRTDITPKVPTARLHTFSDPAITRTEVAEAILNDPDNSPGLDNIATSFIKKCWLASPLFCTVLLKFFRLLFALASIPEIFRKARIVILHKPNQGDSSPSNYRPISLLQSLFKIYCRVLARRWQYVAFGGGRSKRHFGGTPGRSAEDGIAEVVQAIRMAKRDGLCSALMGIDVKGAFNTAQHSYMTVQMKTSIELATPVCGPQPGLLAVCTDMLLRRKIILDFNGERSTPWTSDDGHIGIAQGSPVAMEKWNTYINPLLVRVAARWADQVVLIISYVDDFNVLIRTSSWKETAAVCKEVKEMIRDWAEEAAVKLDKGYLVPVNINYETSLEEKLEAAACMDGVGLASDPKNTVTRGTTNTASILGVRFSRDSTSTATLTQRISYLLETIPQIKAAFHSPICIKTALARGLLYSVLEYGLWPMLPFRTSELKDAQDADNQTACWQLGLFYNRKEKNNRRRYEKVIAHLGILPIQERLWLRVRKTGVLRHGHLTTRPTTLLPEYKQAHKHLGPMDIMREGVTRITGRDYIAPWKQIMPFDEVIIPATKEEAKKLHDEMIPDLQGIVMYTDGSLQGKKHGSGCVIMHKGKIQKLHIINDKPEFGRVFDSEATPMGRGISIVNASPEYRNPVSNKIESIIIFTDSRSCAQKLNQAGIWHTADEPLSEVYTAIANIRPYMEEGATIRLMWIPGHRGIVGNELADVLADEAALMMTETLGANESPVMVEALKKAWERAQRAHKGDGYSRTEIMTGIRYDSTRGREFRNAAYPIGWKEAVLRCVWISGWAFSRAQDRIQHCWECNAPVDTTTVSYEGHLLMVCPSLESLRIELDLKKKDKDPHDWLLQRQGLDTYIRRLEEIKQAHQTQQSLDRSRLHVSQQDRGDGDTFPTIDPTLPDDAGLTEQHTVLADINTSAMALETEEIDDSDVDEDSNNSQAGDDAAPLDEVIEEDMLWLLEQE